jgi:CheY-like chemotaxis protein
MREPLLDPAVIQRLRNLGGDALVRRLLRLFIVTSEESLQRITAAQATSAWHIVQPSAHHLFASAAQLQLEEIANCAAELEASARSGRTEQIESDIARVRAALDVARPALQQVLADLPQAQRIAVVDDSEDVRVLVRLVLEPQFDVTEYPDGTSALTGLRRFPPDLVVIDLTLPDISGMDLLEFMRLDAALRDLPTIALTAMNASEGKSFTDAGFSMHVRKPIVDTEDFLRKVNQLLKNRAWQ